MLGKEGIVLARKERCRRWQPLMIISLASVRATERPTVEDRVADLRGFEYPLHSPRHSDAPLSFCTTHPDLIRHILTSSPSIRLRPFPSLPFLSVSVILLTPYTLMYSYSYSFPSPLLSAAYRLRWLILRRQDLQFLIWL